MFTIFTRYSQCLYLFSHYFAAKYFGAVIIMLSTATTVLIINSYFRGILGNEVPPFLRKLVLNWIARFVGLKRIVDDNFTDTYDHQQVYYNDTCHTICGRYSLQTRQNLY